MKNLNQLAQELYARLYSESDGLSFGEALLEFESIPEFRKRTLKNAIVWLRDQPQTSSLETLLPEFYARTWAVEHTSEFRELKQTATENPDNEIGDIEPWYSAMQNIRDYFQKQRHH